jgi:hypothetical protein
MPPVTTQTQAGVNKLSQDAYDQGQQLQNLYNTQSQQRSGQYDTAFNNAQGAQGDLQGFTKNMVNGNDLYGQNLQNAQTQYGFDPRELLQANKNLATTQTTLANLPQAIQQQGNYYGTTAGQEAGNYGNLAGNINAVLAGQGNAVNAIQSTLNATQNQANQQTNAALTGQQQQLSGYQVAAQNANTIMQNASAAMNQIEQLAQQQGYMTAQQVAAYQNAHSQYINAQAAAQTANAVSQLDLAQKAYYEEQVKEAQSATNPGQLSVAQPNGVQLNGPSSTRNSASILGTLQGGNSPLQGVNFALQGGVL